MFCNASPRCWSSSGAAPRSHHASSAARRTLLLGSGSVGAAAQRRRTAAQRRRTAARASSGSTAASKLGAVTDEDRRYMTMALDLAMRAYGQTHPNPHVGCVVVSPGGAVVGEGFHPKAGQPHAEVFALRGAGEEGCRARREGRRRGAVVWQSLSS